MPFSNNGTNQTVALDRLPRDAILPLILGGLLPIELGALSCVGSPVLRGAVCSAWRAMLEREFPGVEAAPGCAAAVLRRPMNLRGLRRRRLRTEADLTAQRNKSFPHRVTARFHVVQWEHGQSLPARNPHSHPKEPWVSCHDEKLMDAWLRDFFDEGVDSIPVRLSYCGRRRGLVQKAIVMDHRHRRSDRLTWRHGGGGKKKAVIKHI